MSQEGLVSWLRDRCMSLCLLGRAGESKSGSFGETVQFIDTARPVFADRFGFSNRFPLELRI